ncbi:sigma-70 family RNA polymerase sigma factor [Clostridium manihotivorum]|uniref:Sigma-70 family RNA polymerase sigma factor n=1 Tax=Clostridium manihotivorum TaxID=2320868 RepID=A0A3R5QYZ4_9CLOT|nr:sigma-70 family RNA polymerase sigma factor [Clostridium manihotivorum]QAA32868.1 hypothetical protein C1I91_15130 [Clostridium manihotivorum]
MGKNDELLQDIEKGFSSYVKAALYSTSQNYFGRYFKEICNMVNIDSIDTWEEMDFIPTITSNSVVHLEWYLEDDLLSKAVSLLSKNEKELLFIKFFEKNTDEQIARKFGVTRQALTKSKKKILSKLKNRMKS